MWRTCYLHSLAHCCAQSRQVQSRVASKADIFLSTKTKTTICSILCERFLLNLSKMLNRLFSLIPLPVVNGVTRLTLKDIFDGILLATPKRRTPVRRKWQQLYGDDNWKYGQKLWKPKRNIATCQECGGFFEYGTICRSCYTKVSTQTKELAEKKFQEVGHQRAWFEPELAQPSNQKKIADQKSATTIE